jgi:hypothetical protein
MEMSRVEILPFLKAFGPLTSAQISSITGTSMNNVLRACNSLVKFDQVLCMQEYNSRRMLWWAI